MFVACLGGRTFAHRLSAHLSQVSGRGLDGRGLLPGVWAGAISLQFSGFSSPSRCPVVLSAGGCFWMWVAGSVEAAVEWACWSETVWGATISKSGGRGFAVSRGDDPYDSPQRDADEVAKSWGFPRRDADEVAKSWGFPGARRVEEEGAGCAKGPTFTAGAAGGV